MKRAEHPPCPCHRVPPSEGDLRHFSQPASPRQRTPPSTALCPQAALRVPIFTPSVCCPHLSWSLDFSPEPGYASHCLTIISPDTHCKPNTSKTKSRIFSSQRCLSPFLPSPPPCSLPVTNACQFHQLNTSLACHFPHPHCHHSSPNGPSSWVPTLTHPSLWPKWSFASADLMSSHCFNLSSSCPWPLRIKSNSPHKGL